MKNILLIFASFYALQSCAVESNETASHSSNESAELEKKKSPSKNLEVAYFASGCFWCVEEIFEAVKGVDEVYSGYSGGIIKNPTYEEICTGRLQHAEAVKVIYDPSVVSFETLVDVFFNSHDPSTFNRQGPDSGPQYRSIAFYSKEIEREVILIKIKALKATNAWNKITTEVKKFDVFYMAEDYHQDYIVNHPNNGYVQSVSIPRFENFKEKMPEILK